MRIEFEDPELERLFTEGKSKAKYLRSLPKGVVKGFFKAVNHLIAARNTEALYPLKSLDYKKLEGKDYERVKINDQYRLLFRSRVVEDDSEKVTVAQLHKISNHYEDL